MKNKQFCSAFLSGFLICIGNTIYLSCDNKIVGAFLFSIALLTIVHYQLNLFTGKIGYINNSIELYNCIEILCANLIGGAMCVLLLPQKWGMFDAAAASMFPGTWYEILSAAFFCGIMMYLAIDNKTGSKLLTIPMCIMIFMLSGFEHCVAKFPILLFNSTPHNLLLYILVIIGNTIGAIFIHKVKGVAVK